MNDENHSPASAPAGLFGGWRKLKSPPEKPCYFWVRVFRGWDPMMARVFQGPRGRWMLDNPFAHGGPEYLSLFTDDDDVEFCGPIPEPPNSQAEAGGPTEGKP